MGGAGGRGRVERRRTCWRCDAALPLGARTCPACGAVAWPAPPEPADRPAPIAPGVGPVDLVSLVLQAAAAFVGGTLAATLGKAQIARAAPWLADRPLAAGGLAAAVVFGAGCVYLGVLWRRSRRQRRRGGTGR